MSKLYATIESEKARKGQGGQKYIKIELAHGSAKDSKIEYTAHYDETGLTVKGVRGILLDTKGEKQKAECGRVGCSKPCISSTNYCKDHELP